MGVFSIGSSGRPITKFKIFGERNSGTNYAAELLSRNFPDLSQNAWYPWEKHQFVHIPFVPPSTLAVVIVRNAHDWLKSMYRNPHQIAGWVYDVDFHSFLKHEWSCRTNGMILNKPPRKLGLSLNDELMFDRHPVTGERIENIVVMRGLKMRSYLKVPLIYPDFVVVQYEQLRDTPVEFLKTIMTKFNLKADELTTIQENVSRNGIGKNSSISGDRSSGLHYSDQDLDFIKRTLDRDAEASFGYNYNTQFELTERTPAERRVK